jgi:hypothetical protein
MPTQYSLVAGETLVDVASRHGFHPQTIWDDPANAALRENRGRPTALCKGDTLVIPDLRPRQESCATGQKHVFRRLGVPAPPWISIRVVDDATSVPVAGVRVRVRPPGGEEQEHETDEDGWVEIAGITRGTCGVAGGSEFQDAELAETLGFVALGEEPAESDADDDERDTAEEITGRWIAEVEEHKVQTGETLASLAEGAGLTWQRLARFNWGTEDPKEINEHLRDHVGCTKKTADGKNYVFSSDDDPGIVYIPRPWSLEDLETDRAHTIRVRRPRVEQGREWEFSI